MQKARIESLWNNKNKNKNLQLIKLLDEFFIYCGYLVFVLLGALQFNWKSIYDFLQTQCKRSYPNVGPQTKKAINKTTDLVVIGVFFYGALADQSSQSIYNLCIWTYGVILCQQIFFTCFILFFFLVPLTSCIVLLLWKCEIE